MNQTSLANAADYADALLIARRAKRFVAGLLLFVLVIQLILFFVLRYYKPLPTGNLPTDHHIRDVVQYFVGLTDIAGLFLPTILTVILYLILKVQLVGRLLGTARLTSAFLWSILLCLLLFPWQAILNNPAINSNPAADELGMKIPGVLYTWAEISHPIIGARFGMVTSDSLGESQAAVGSLHWARYVFFPILSLTILSVIQLRSARGLRESLGEAKSNPATNPVD